MNCATRVVPGAVPASLVRGFPEFTSRIFPNLSCDQRLSNLGRRSRGGLAFEQLLAVAHSVRRGVRGERPDV